MDTRVFIEKENRMAKAESRPGAQRHLQTAVIRESEGFAALEKEWDELYKHCPTATPFQSWAWLYSWWEHYGEGRELRIITVRDADGFLVGVVPLMLERRMGVRRLLFVATGHATYLDLLLRESWEEEVAEACAAMLERMGGWWVADLQELRPEAAAWRVFKLWRKARTSSWQDYCTLVEAKPWDEVLASINSKDRNDARRTLKRAEAAGAYWALAELEAAEQAAATLVGLNRQQWQERWRDTSPDHWSQRFKAHLQTAARRMTAYGLGAISEFHSDGATILSTFLLFGKDSVGGYIFGANREALHPYSYNSLLVRNMVTIARQRSVSYIDFLGGEDSYKLRWNPKIVYNRRIILGRNPIYWAPYAAYLILRSKAVRFARSEDSPDWAKEAAHRYVRLRYMIARLADLENVSRSIRRATTWWFEWRGHT